MPNIVSHPPQEPPAADLVSFFKYFLVDHRALLACLFVCGFGVALADAMIAVFIGKMVGFVGQSDRQTAWNEQWPQLVGLFLVIGVARPIMVWLDLWLRNARFIPAATSRMRWISHWHVVRQSWGFFQSQSPGGIAHWVMQTPGALRETAEAAIRAVWYLGMYSLTSIAILTTADWRLALPILVWSCGYALLLRRFVPELRVRADKNADRWSRLLAELVDCYSNILTVKLFTAAATSDSRIRDALLDHNAAQERHMASVTGFITRLTLLNTALLLGTATIGGALWLNGLLPAEAVAMALPLVWQAASTGGWVAWEVAGIYQNLGEIRQGMQVIAAPNLMPELAPQSEKTPAVAQSPSSISFEDVTFAYGDAQPVLRRFSLAIAPGEKLGIVGRSGAGKSTIVALLARLMDVQSGTIRIDGRDVRTLPIDELRARLAIVSQDVSLFHRSLRDNILCGKPEASTRELADALDRAQASRFVADVEDADGRRGLDAVVGERGGRLSGGQRQRIMLARALLKPASIVVLDEATSALDSEVEQTLQRDLAAHLSDKTVIAIAHRLSTLTRMDRILVIDGGAIIEEGSHEALLGQNGVYAALWRQQTTSDASVSAT